MHTSDWKWCKFNFACICKSIYVQCSHVASQSKIVLDKTFRENAFYANYNVVQFTQHPRKPTGKITNSRNNPVYVTNNLNWFSRYLILLSIRGLGCLSKNFSKLFQLCDVMENTGYMSMDNLIMQISSQKPRNEVNWMTINKIASRRR